MPTNVFAPAVPANERNFMTPQRISAWFRSACPDGSLADAVELGSIGEPSFSPAETVTPLKSNRRGVMSTTRNVITEIDGKLSFKLHEVVGSNVNLLWRPLTTEHKTGVNGEVIYAQSNVRLEGTTASQIGSDAQEYDPATNVVSYPAVTLIRVEALAIVDPSTGRATQYSPSDYVLTQPSSATQYSLHVTRTAGTTVPAVGGTFALLNATTDFLRGYDGLTGSGVVNGEVVTASAGETGTGLVVAQIALTSTTGYIVVRNITLSASLADNVVLTGAGGTVVINTAGNPTAPVFTVVSYSLQNATVVDVIATLGSVGGAGQFTVAQVDSLVAQAVAASALGIGVTVINGTLPRITLFETVNASVGATITRTSGSAIPDGAEVVVCFSYKRNGISYSILDGVQIEGELRLQVLTLNGPQSVYVFPRVNLNTSGEQALSGERFEPTMEASILPDGTGNRGRLVILDGYGVASTVQC